MTPVASWHIGLHTFCAYCERALDLPGYIPLIGPYSAPFRTQLAIGQLIVAMVLGVFFLTSQAYHHFYGSSPFFSAQLVEDYKTTGLSLSKSALGNLIRAWIEATPFINVLLFSFDQQKSKSNPLIFQNLPDLFDSRLHLPVLFWPSTSSSGS